MNVKLTGPSVMFGSGENINEGLPRSFMLALILIGTVFHFI